LLYFPFQNDHGDEGKANHAEGDPPDVLLKSNNGLASASVHDNALSDTALSIRVFLDNRLQSVNETLSLSDDKVSPTNDFAQGHQYDEPNMEFNLVNFSIFIVP